MPQPSDPHPPTQPEGVEMPTSPAGAPTDGATAHRGPRGHRGEIRDRIRSAARRAFVEDGHDGTTVRGVAREVGCDAALVSYYFGTKSNLFRECFDLPSDPAREMLEILLQDPSTAGERLVRHVLALYEERLTAESLSALIRAQFTDQATSQRFQEYVRTGILDRLNAHLGAGSAAAEQLELAMAHIYGVVTMRFVLRLEPIASMPRERLVAELAPFIQARLNRMLLGNRPR